MLPGLSVSVLTSCSSDAARDTGSGPNAADLPPRTVALRTQGGAFRFDPGGLWLQPGSSLTWLNMGDFHTTTAFHPANSKLVGGKLPLRIPARAEPWHSGMLGLDAGTQYERRFMLEGVYDYLCQPHYGFGMVGRLVVGQRDPRCVRTISLPGPHSTNAPHPATRLPPTPTPEEHPMCRLNSASNSTSAPYRPRVTGSATADSAFHHTTGSSVLRPTPPRRRRSRSLKTRRLRARGTPQRLSTRRCRARTALL